MPETALGAMLWPSAFPNTRLWVGVDRDPDDGSLRVYLGARYTGIHTHLPVGSEADRAEALWPDWGHRFIEVPAEALCDCHPELTPALATEA